jgi:PAS domain S-box-containing protein
MYRSTKVNVLMVDDHIESLIALEAVLGNINYNIIKATSGEEALRHLLKADFALILLDVQMPELNGFEIARLIRQREKNRGIPIIFITGYGKEQKQIAEGYSTGAVDYLLKPIDPDILRAKCEFFSNLYLRNEAIKEAGYKYKELLDGVRAIVWRAEPENLELTFVSKEAEIIFGFPLENWLQKGFWKGRIHPLDREDVINACERALDRQTPEELEYRMTLKDGSTKWFENLIHASVEDGKTKELIGILVDVTERKEAEETIRRANEALELRVKERTDELRKTNQWLRNLIGNIPGVVYRWSYSQELKVEFVSDLIEKISGHAAAEFIEGKRSYRDLVYEDDWGKIEENLVEILTAQEPYELEYRIARLDGRIRWVQDRGRGIFEEGNLLFLDGVIVDITERKKSEEMLKSSLREKDVLLREIHHRVKNNLQIISSLLNLQKSDTRNTDTKEVLTECQNRVRSMALIHEKLYETNDLARIDFSTYIQDLTSYLFRSYGTPATIQRRIDSEKVQLNIDTAIPCGLIVHELVSNALKYAFPNGGPGEIQIRLGGENGKYLLTVSDNGVGLPKGLDFRSVESLGMRLVNTLTNQLDGKVEMENQNGTTFRIWFSQIRTESPVPVTA